MIESEITSSSGMRSAMSPVGGPAARRLRGLKGSILLDVTCTCGRHYEVAETARGRAKCPDKRCMKPTREIPIVS